MKELQRVILWTTIAAVALLGILSIIGAFVGADAAGRLFNSPPLVIFWFLLAGLLLVGLMSFRRLVRSPGLLVVHLGSLLLLVGAMYGSERGHAVTRVLTGREKIYSGYMVVNEGETADLVLDRTQRHLKGRLPFSVKLERFWMEYYPLKDATWQLIVEAGRPQRGGSDMEWQQAAVAWAAGKTVDVPFTSAKVRVLGYLPAARPIYGDNAVSTLEITGSDGKKTSLPAKAGAEVSLKEPKVKLRIAQVFTSIAVEGTGEERKVLDKPGSGGPPALKVEVEQPGQKTSTSYVFKKGFGAHGETPLLHMEYVLAGPVGAEPDPSAKLPAMEILLICNGRETRAWLVPEVGENAASLPLTPLTGGRPGTPEEHDRTNGTSGEGATHPEVYLHFVRPQPQVKDFKSHLVVLDNGLEVERKVIEVNDPLHYGGYHFYQHDYDQENGRYTVLSVSSDSGLYMAYVGFAALVLGVFWLFWRAPAGRYLSRGAGANGR